MGEQGRNRGYGEKPFGISTVPFHLIQRLFSVLQPKSPILSPASINSHSQVSSCWFFSFPTNKKSRALKSRAMEDRPRQSKKRKRDKHRKSEKKKENSSQLNVTHQPNQASSALSNPTKSKGSTFLDKMRARLSGGHFRMINEKLYTCRFFFFVNSLTITMLIYFWVILVSLIFVLCVCVVFILSGKDALDYFKEDPALFDVVSFVFFIQSMNSP